jgi:hypothetical protein
MIDDYLDPEGAVSFPRRYNPWHELDMLNHAHVPTEHPGIVMLGELRQGERSANHRDCLGPSLTQLFEEEGDRHGRD